MSELHISHYDDEQFFTIEAHDTEAVNVLKALDATLLRDNLYRLPVAQVVPFLARRFSLGVAAHGHRTISDAQREARRKSLAQARARRWAKTQR